MKEKYSKTGRTFDRAFIKILAGFDTALGVIVLALVLHG